MCLPTPPSWFLRSGFYLLNFILNALQEAALGEDYLFRFVTHKCTSEVLGREDRKMRSQEWQTTHSFSLFALALSQCHL